jgi:hypothetical protein
MSLSSMKHQNLFEHQEYMQMQQEESLRSAHCIAKKARRTLLYDFRSLNVRKQSSCLGLAGYFIVFDSSGLPLGRLLQTP